MLTSSPIISHSANASPSTFHYAPTRSPHSSPSRTLAGLPRRQTKSSATVSSRTSSAQIRSRPYVGIDAATQYSPMEPVSYVEAPREAASANPPLVPRPQPAAASSGLLQQPTLPAPPPMPQASPTTLLSPSKRRNSQSPATNTARQAESSSAATKRARQSARPPKLLPQRYELCENEDMVVLISHMLAELIETNDALALRSGSLTRFHSR
jgi:hypothetical protein